MLYISYSHCDAAIQCAIENFLHGKNFSFWADKKDLKLDLPLEPQIIDALKRCDATLLIDSVASRRSTWVTFELASSRRLGNMLWVVTVGRPEGRHRPARHESVLEACLESWLSPEFIELASSGGR